MREVEKIILTRAEIVALQSILSSMKDSENNLFCQKIKTLLENNLEPRESNVVDFSEYRNQQNSNIVYLAHYNRKKL